MPSVARRGRGSLVTVLALVLALAGCAGLPSKGKVTPEARPSDQSNNNIGMTPQKPKPEWSPNTFVSNFLFATSGLVQDPTYSTASSYLTPDAAKRWKPSEMDTIVLTNKVITLGPPTITADKRTQDVEVFGTPVAQLDARGFSSWQTGPSRPYTLHLVGAGAGQLPNWHIQDPPTQRLVELVDLRHAVLTPLTAYLPLSYGDTGSPYHVDQVYLTPSSNIADDVYTPLVDAVLSGGPASRYGWTGTPTGAVRGANVVLTTDSSNSSVVTATVTLSKGPSKPESADLLARAILRTLQAVPTSTQYNSVQPISNLRLKIPGTTDILKSARPDTGPVLTLTPRVYAVVNGKVRYFDEKIDPNQLESWVDPPKTNWLSSTEDVEQLAVKTPSPDLPDTGSDRPGAVGGGPTYAVSVAGQNQKSGDSVLVGTDSNNQPATAYAAKGKVTSLAWDPADGSLWVVDGGRLYHVVLDGDHYTPTEVGINPALQSGTAPTSGTLQTIRFSPDGQQAVLITTQTGADPNATSQAWLTTVDPSRLVFIPQFELQPEGASPSQQFNQVYDAGWAGGRTIVLLAKDFQSTQAKVYQIYADGSQDADLAAVQDDTGPIDGRYLTTVGTNAGKVSTKTFVSGPLPTLDVNKPGPSKIYRTHPPTLAGEGSSPVIATIVFANGTG